MTRAKTQKLKAGEPTHLSVRVDGSMIMALDQEAKRMEAERPGLKFTRTDALCVVLHEWASAQAKKYARP
jgi:hypothetical protein